MSSFPVGTSILARLPENDELVVGKVLHENKTGTYRIQLLDGTRVTLPREDVTENKDAVKTPRRKSPGRTPKAGSGRGRSPGRKPRDSSVGRKKSPGRRKADQSIKAETPEVTTSPRRSERERKPATKFVPETQIPSDSPSLRLRKWQPTPTKTSMMETVVDSDGEEVRVPRSSRELNGDEVDAAPTVETEMGGAFGLLLMVILSPLIVLTGHLMLRNAELAVAGMKPNQTDLIMLTVQGSLDLRSFDIRKLALSFPKFDLMAAYIYFGFMLVQLILNFLPIGSFENVGMSTSHQKYRLNGKFSAIFTIALFFALRHYGYTLSRKDLINMLPQWIVMACGTAFVVSCFCYYWASRQPLSQHNLSLVNTGKIYNFFMGRQINPCFGPLNLKMFLFKNAINGVIILHILTFFQLDETQKTNPLLLYIGFVNFYALDSFFFEKYYLHTFDYTSEGTGLMTLIAYFLYPFYPLMATNYLAATRFDLNIYCCMFIVALYILGYIVYRASNAEKSEYRRNPVSPALAHLETIPTRRGNQLLCSGWWGIVRHPNYFGDIIMHTTWGLVSGFHHPLPWVLPVLTIIYLITRASRIEKRCQAKYGDSWARYCEMVNKRIFPKVY